MIRWPFTNLHELNLDWLISQMKDLIDKVDSYADKITASATTGPAGSSASVTVTGDLENGMNLAFTIPRGDTGATGATGPAGQDGAVAIHVSSKIFAEGTVSIAAGSSDYLTFNIDSLVDVNNSGKLIGIRQWALSNAPTACVPVSMILASVSNVLKLKLEVYNPTGSAISLGSMAFVEIVYYS